MRRFLALWAIWLFAALLPGSLAAATLELVEVKPDDPWGGWAHAGDGHMVQDDSYGRYGLDATWTPPPAVIDDAGFALTMTVTAKGLSEHTYAGIGANSDGLLFDPFAPSLSFKVEAGESATQTITAYVRPREGLEAGQRIRLSIGPNTAPGVSYFYQVTTGGGGGWLRATHDCPAEIVISALPSVNCHLILSGWRRNTADPVRVLLPQALDTYGNHANGIQVLGQGEEDVFNWDEPRSWGLFIFACPAQQGTGANCYDNVTVPGPVSVPILVQQGDDPPVRVDLDFTAVPHP